MTDPFATPDPRTPQEPTPVYDSANPADTAPQAPQPNEPAPVLYGESFTFTETSTPAPNPYGQAQPSAYGAPAGPSAATFGAPAPADPNAAAYGTPAYSAPVDPNAAAFNAPAYGGAPAAADPNAAAFNAPAPTAPAYTAPTYPAPAPVDPTAATYGTPTYEAPTVPPAPTAAPAYGTPTASVPPAPAASYTTSTGLPYTGTSSYDQIPPAAAPGYAPAQPGMPVGSPYGATAAEPPINMPWYGIDFVNAIKRFFTKYATFSGRASRGEFWWVFLFLFLVSFVFNLLSRASDVFNVLSAIWGLVTIVPQIALSVRRVHDANLPGGWVALPYGIEVVGAMVMAISTVGAVASGLSGSSSGFGGGMAGILVGLLIVIGGAVTAIVLFAKQSDPQGARFDRP